MYRPLYQNNMINANQTSTIDTHTKKKKQCKQNPKDNHQITRKENKRGREEKRLTKTNPKQLKNGNKNTHINNYLRSEWINCSNQRQRLAERI